MKKAITLVLIIMLCFGRAQMEENDMHLYQSYNQLKAEFGQPIKDMLAIKIWKRESSFFIGGFSNISNELILTNYIETDFDGSELSSSIDPHDTTDHVLGQIKEQFKVDSVYDIGSGNTINAKICNDGYLVIWREYKKTVRVSLYDYCAQRVSKTYLLK